MPTVYVRTVRRTAELLGGHDALADYLKVQPHAVKKWIDGVDAIPAEAFLACVDYLAELTIRPLEQAADEGEHDQQAG